MLDSDHTDQGKALGVVEIGHEIYVRSLACLIARHRTEERQMQNTCVPQLNLVIPKLSYDFRRMHGARFS